MAHLPNLTKFPLNTIYQLVVRVMGYTCINSKEKSTWFKDQKVSKAIFDYHLSLTLDFKTF